MNIEQAYYRLQKISAKDQAQLLSQLNEKQVLILSSQLLNAVKILLEEGVNHLSTITGVYQGETLIMLYHFWLGEGLTLRVIIDENNNEVDTLTQFIPGALFYEREIAEMFGITINGIDTSNKMFLPDNWQNGAPMRKEKAEIAEDNSLEDK